MYPGGRVTEERRRLELPDRRKNTYEQLEERLDEHIDEIEGHLQKWIKRGLIAFSIIALCCILALIGFGFVLREVQGQRHDVCTAQNKRHDQTIRLFNVAEADAIKKHPEQKSQLDDSKAANLAIINALAPKQNCDKIAPEGRFFP